MLFTSADYPIFFFVVWVVLLIVPKKLRIAWVLIASLFFYGCKNPMNLVFLLLSIFATWGTALCMDRKKNGIEIQHRKLLLIIGLTINFGMLIALKYIDFIMSSISSISVLLSGVSVDQRFGFSLPIGISFYVFSATGYLIEVYRHKAPAERNLIVYALFSSFFPNIMSGPIERANHLLPQIKAYCQANLLDFERIMRGATLVLWGFFLKMVLADRLTILVDTVYSQYYLYGSVELLTAAIFYSFQIYCDFASYSIIALGFARVIGIELLENFDAPYFSGSVKEFWRRWHMSLSSWLRDYIYFPLGGSRCSKPRKMLNVMITFLVSGLWHGAAWNYVLWGGLHGALQAIGDMTDAPKKRIQNRFHMITQGYGYHIGKTILTFFIITFAWIFFRAPNLESAFGIIERIFTCPNPWALSDGTLYQIGLELKEMNVLSVSLVVLLLVDLFKRFRKQNIDQFLVEQPIWFRWIVLLGLLFATITFGIYGPAFNPTSFLYFQF